MGVPKFFRWLSERYPKINQPITCRPIDEDDDARSRPTFYSDDGTPALFVGREHRRRQKRRKDDNSNKEEGDVVVVSAEEEGTEEVEDIDECVIMPEFDRLYLDMNGIIHGCSHNNANHDLTAIGSGGTTTDGDMGDSSCAGSGKAIGGVTREDVVNNVCYYLDRIVGDIVKPRDVVYVAIDGVAPRAKLNQQRSRRFRSGKESEIAERTARARRESGFTDLASPEKGDVANDEGVFDSITRTSSGGYAGTIRTGGGGGCCDDGKNFGAENREERVHALPLDGRDPYVGEDDVTPFHSNSITPGTPFLEYVSDHILHFIRHKMKHDPAWRHLRVYYSGPDVPGEGEHKIMQFIRDERSKPDYDPNTRHCLYGQDGDLIMLGLATHEPHFCLLREEVKFGPEREKAERAAAEAAVAAAAEALTVDPSPDGIPTTAARESIHQYTHNSKFELLHMSILRDYLALEFETSNIYRGSGDKGGGSPYDLERTIDDFVFLTFFVGNDFLPHMPALDIADGAFDLLFHTYKKHRKRWQREAKAAAAVAAEGDDGAGEMLVNDPYLTYAGTIVSGNRLEHFLADVGRHEDPVLHKKKRGEKRLNKRIRKDDRKHGRTSSIPSHKEMAVRERSQREKYREMLESMEIPSSDMDGSDDDNPSFTPVMSSTVALPPSNYPKRKHRPPQMTEEREMTSDVERGVLNILTSLVRNSISPQQQKDKHHPLAEIADAHVGQDGTAGGAVPNGMEDANASDTSRHDDDDGDSSVADYDDLKGRYYFDKFGFTPVDSENHRALRRAYVEGLAWCLDYYYRGCTSWEWYYPYHYGPMLSDLVDIDKYLEELSFEPGEPLRPFEQLLGCLPPSSSYLLPQPYRWLMTAHNSPIREYYPEEFTIDMNGKRYPWEAVVLLPFIDAGQLIHAARTLVTEETLTLEERRRNTFGQAVLIQNDVSVVDNLPAVGESTGFGQINACNTRTLVCTGVGLDGDDGLISDGAKRFRPKILPGARLPHPGFPTLTEAPVQGLLRKKLKLNIFGTPSRYLTAALLMDGKLPDFPAVDKLGKKFVGTTVYFRYPYLQEAFVTAVSDSQKTVRGLEPSRPWTEQEQIEWEERRDSLHAQHRSGDGRTGSGGWLLPQSDVMLSVRPLKGLETVPGGSGLTLKVYSEFEVEVPLAAALWSPTYPDPRYSGVPARLEKNPYLLPRKVPEQGANKVENKNESCILSPPSPLSSSRPSHSETCRTSVAIGVKVTNGGLPPLPPAKNENVKTTAAALLASSIHHREALPVLPTYSSKKIINKVKSASTRSASSLSLCVAERPIIAPEQRHRSLPLRRLGAAKSGSFRFRGVTTVAAAAAILALPGAMRHADGAQVGNPTCNHAISKPNGSINGIQPEYVSFGDKFVRGGHVDGDAFVTDKDHLLSQSESVSVPGTGNCPGFMPTSSSSPPPLEFSHGTTTISFIFSGGIVAAVDSRASIGSFVGSKTTQKVLPINKHILGTMAGGAADCSFWIRKLRSEAKLLELNSFEDGRCISVARASRILANALYANRSLKLSVGTMVMGYDYDGGKPSIYYVSDSGARIKGDMFAVGSGSTFALGILDTERRFDMSESEAIALAIKAIRHATFRDAYSGGYIGVYVITREGWKKVFSEDLALITEEEGIRQSGKGTT